MAVKLAVIVLFIILAGALTSVVLKCGLLIDTWLRLAVWLAIGLAIYFSYGAKHSLIAMAG